MAGSDEGQIISHDWTRLFRHRSRSFTMGDYAYSRGVDWVGAGWAAATAVVVSGGLTYLLIQIGFRWWWAGLVIGAVAAGIVYRIVAKDTGGDISPIESAKLWLDYRLFQPAMMQGVGSDVYPTDLHWQVILYRPEDMPVHSNAFPEAAPYGTYRK
ncbi:hypothetical protein [Prescottella agglutinans]|uniref:Uncharacterized protein n=1 Tax=Prescottella agglutinans TaxID=1644129 RepID=A0ABT6MJW5_9NOCA|nr:hypothetical protein [Prescottella agglutinans]MDH6284587.1 hypothetical protein [Prescottella agglutinans]